ncbi:STAS domain-containing protein [candidate division KSB1 bacterium]|nr:STAS domain-containing protein [candidate division KSB1 bacterium]
MEQGIDIKISHVGAQNNITLLRVQGFVDTNTCSELRKYIEQSLLTKKFNLIVDLGAVSYVSSAGWGVFVGEIRNIRENGGDLRIVQMMPDVYEVFEMLEFNRILSYHDNIEEVINDFDLAVGYDITQNLPRKVLPNQPKELIIPKIQRDNIMPAEKDGRAQKARKPSAKPKTDAANLPLIEKIKLIVIDNPLNGLFQIRKELVSRRFGYTKIGILKLFQILKRNNWETAEKRIRFYRSR